VPKNTLGLNAPELTTRPTNPDHILVFNRWDGYLAQYLYPSAAVSFVEMGPELIISDSIEIEERSLVLLHFNVSRWGRLVADIQDLLDTVKENGGTVWNVRIRDIRKSVVQDVARRIGLPTTGVGTGVPPDTPVLLKTELNARGRPETRLSNAALERLGLSRLAEPVCAPEYQKLRAGELTLETWEDPRLHIERYIHRGDGTFYRVFFAGVRCILCEGRSQAVIKRMEIADGRQDFLLHRALAGDALVSNMLGAPRAAVFAAAVVFSDAFGLDFGSIDLVVDDDDAVYVVDVNVTPYWGGRAVLDSYLEHLAGRPSQAAAH